MGIPGASAPPMAPRHGAADGAAPPAARAPAIIRTCVRSQTPPFCMHVSGGRMMRVPQYGREELKPRARQRFRAPSEERTSAASTSVGRLTKSRERACSCTRQWAPLPPPHAPCYGGHCRCRCSCGGSGWAYGGHGCPVCGGGSGCNVARTGYSPGCSPGCAAGCPHCYGAVAAPQPVVYPLAAAAPAPQLPPFTCNDCADCVLDSAAACVASIRPLLRTVARALITPLNAAFAFLAEITGSCARTTDPDRLLPQYATAAYKPYRGAYRSLPPAPVGRPPSSLYVAQAPVCTCPPTASLAPAPALFRKADAPAGTRALGC